MFLKSVWTLCLVIAIIKLWLTSHLPIIASYGEHDNLRYIQMAWEIFNFKAPFYYDQYTLMRPPGYPFFIRLSYILGFSLRFSQEILYLGSGFFFAWSFYQYYKSKLIVFIFLILHIFLPASFLWNRATIQESLYLPLTIFIMSCLIHLFNQPFVSKPFLLWSFNLGLGFAWFYNTRPEGILIVPSIAILYIPLFINALRPQLNKRIAWQQLQKSILLILIPVVIVTSLISLTTYFKYGVFTVSDLTSPGIKTAYAQLTSIEPEKLRRFVPVQEETRFKVYAVSPSFKKLSTYLEQLGLGKAWFIFGCQAVKVCDDYAGGWFVWALRDAVAYAGEYKSAPETEAFYQQIASEIKSACISGRLSCNNSIFSISAFSPEIRSEYIKPFLKSFSKLSQTLLNQMLMVNLNDGEKDLSHRKKFYERITRESFDFIKYRNLPVNQLKDKFIYSICALYKFCLPILLGISTISLILGHLKGVNYKKVSARIPLIIILIMLLTIILRVALIAYIDTTSFPGDFRYLWPIVPLLLMSVAIGISYFIEIFNLKTLQKWNNASDQ
ncbi:MAG: hypothetical protein V7K27_19120 [Nostoc sp.]